MRYTPPKATVFSSTNKFLLGASLKIHRLSSSPSSASSDIISFPKSFFNQIHILMIRSFIVFVMYLLIDNNFHEINNNIGNWHLAFNNSIYLDNMHRYLLLFKNNIRFHFYFVSITSITKISPLPLVKTTVETDAPLLSAQNTDATVGKTNVKLIHILSYTYPSIPPKNTSVIMQSAGGGITKILKDRSSLEK
ncbi:hypothetical protein AGLY_015975 [Aphis glycines]|uniref:Uncharacterized protein n=1 Tax=Aphis glycines TaxID=307491 RepID=A0A6G0SYH5_APHGL|nr:hypothetical protein AGLY_015975 [Aphis glycines]